MNVSALSTGCRGSGAVWCTCTRYGTSKGAGQASKMKADRDD